MASFLCALRPILGQKCKLVLIFSTHLPFFGYIFSCARKKKNVRQNPNIFRTWLLIAQVFTFTPALNAHQQALWWATTHPVAILPPTGNEFGNAQWLFRSYFLSLLPSLFSFIILNFQKFPFCRFHQRFSLCSICFIILSLNHLKNYR